MELIEREERRRGDHLVNGRRRDQPGSAHAVWPFDDLSRDRRASKLALRIGGDPLSELSEGRQVGDVGERERTPHRRHPQLRDSQRRKIGARRQLHPKGLQLLVGLGLSAPRRWRRPAGPGPPPTLGVRVSVDVNRGRDLRRLDARDELPLRVLAQHRAGAPVDELLVEHARPS